MNIPNGTMESFALYMKLSTGTKACYSREERNDFKSQEKSEGIHQ